MMVVENKFNIGDEVYLKTDPDQNRRIVFGITINSNGIMYEMISGLETSTHFDFEISTEKNVLV